jgi:calcium-dependent protein kinase
VLIEEKMWMLFKQFDVDDKNNITRKDVRDAIKKDGKVISKEEMNQVFDEHDLERNGTISF